MSSPHRVSDHDGSRRRPPTLADVAREARVSTTTVSLVLRVADPPDITARTQQRVRDVVQQIGYVRIVTLGHQGMHLRPVALRYSWPSELDLMAEQAGLRLRERSSGWDRRPFDSSSGGHVSI